MYICNNSYDYICALFLNSFRKVMLNIVEQRRKNMKICMKLDRIFLNIKEPVLYLVILLSII